MPTVRANGIMIYYEMHGAGEPLLLIGGLGADITLLRLLIASLSPRHQVIAFDNRGAGRSDKPDLPYTIAMLASDTADLLEALGVRGADVAGISMGGKIALELALSYPHLVGRLVLISTYPPAWYWRASRREQGVMPRARGQTGYASGVLV